MFTFFGKCVYNACIEMGKVIVYEFITLKEMPTLKYSALKVIVEPNTVDNFIIQPVDNDSWRMNKIEKYNLIIKIENCLNEFN